MPKFKLRYPKTRPAWEHARECRCVPCQSKRLAIRAAKVEAKNVKPFRRRA